MCQFFSCISDGKGNIKYFNAEQRNLMRGEELKGPDGSRYDSSLQDSHSGIAGFCGWDCDKVNKYEYNPLTKRFVIDQINIQDDSAKVKRVCRKLDFAAIVPELIIKPIFHPFEHKKRKRVNQTDIDLLKKWASVWASVGASVWASVWDSVWDSVGASVRASVRDSMRDSVGDSVGAYVSSFFDLPKWKRIKHKKGENPFQSCIDLWHRGIVPSFDGKAWRLHGYKAKVLKVIPKDEL